MNGNDAPPGPKLLVMPHVGVIGGAGLYNRRAIDELAQHGRVTLLGDAARDYVALGRSIATATPPPRPVLPAYAGASLRAFLFYALLAPVRFVRLWLWAYRHRTMLSDFDALVATSSIDCASLLAIGRAMPRARLVCIVQENVFLSGRRGRLNRLLLGRMDMLVSITSSWAARAAACGIVSVVATNQFDPCPEPLTDADEESAVDLLFVGGDARIKGFELFLSVIDHLARRRSIRVALLGTLDEDAATRVADLQARLAEQGSRLSEHGFVGDTRRFYAGARLLLLPITAPHFCRPAIEAGLCGTTFIISRLPELDDFAHDGDNCAMCDANDVDAWLAMCETLLDNDAERDRLAARNHALARGLSSPTAFSEAYRHALAPSR